MLSREALAAMLLSSEVPSGEVTDGSAGSEGMAPRADHRHPRLTSAGVYTLAANSKATVTFTRLFTSKPAVVCLLVESADNQPVIFKVESWVQDGSLNYTGCVVRGYRSVVLPQNLVSLLLGAVFNLFGGTAASAEFCCIALMPS